MRELRIGEIGGCGMSEFLKNELEKIKGQTHIISIPIEGFERKEELVEFVKIAKGKKIGTALHYETSNFHQGVVVEIFDKETCVVKDHLGIMQ